MDLTFWIALATMGVLSFFFAGALVLQIWFIINKISLGGQLKFMM
jgi:hypothetical protein